METKELTRAEQNWKGGNKVASVKEEAPAPGLKSREGKKKKKVEKEKSKQ